MILKSCSFEDMALQIQQNRKNIIIFGAGMIGTVTVSALLKNYHLEHKVSFYVDNDPNKWGKCVSVAGMEYKIFSVERLKQIKGRNNVIFLTTSRFSDSLSQLENIENLQETVCYMIPMMCIFNFRPSEKTMITKESCEPLIPKIIHYMWLGNKDMPKSLQLCIDSWKKYCPDYEILCWNESNYDIEKNLYMKQAYEQKMYGFVPDYARLDLLYTYGGIYLDTDVELVRKLDDLLYQKAFCSVEKWQTINFGGGSGSVKNSEAIGKLLKERENLQFVDQYGNRDKNTCGYYDTLALEKYGYKICGGTQKVLDLNIYSYDVFHPYDYMSGRTDVSANTYGIHHFNGGWLDDKLKKANQRTANEFERVYKLASNNL